MATQWLESQVGPLGISSEPTERELISCLRNGLILCNAINKIHPGAVPKVLHYNPEYDLCLFIVYLIERSIGSRFILGSLSFSFLFFLSLRPHKMLKPLFDDVFLRLWLWIIKCLHNHLPGILSHCPPISIL